MHNESGQGGPLGFGIIPALTHQQHHNQPQQQPDAPATNDHAATGGAAPASNPGLLGGGLYF